MQPISVIPRLAVALATGLLVAWAFAPGASAQLQPGDILVVDPDAPPVSTAVLFQVDPQSGARTVLSNFGAGSPSAVAIEADGDILITDTAAGTDPTGGTSELGVLYRLSRDPVTGALIRTVLTDFGVGADTGRNPRAVAVEADGQILVTTGRPGTLNDKPLLVRVDPVTGARAILSDFRDSSQGGVGIEPRGIAIEAGGAILVIDAQGGPNALGELFRINPQTGFRTSVSRFNTPILGTTPTSVAVEVTGQILVTDEGHLTTPLGLLFRIDPQSGLRTVLSDFNTGANTGREPAGVAIEADGQILVVDRHAGPLTQGMLFRVDPQTGARTIVSDFAIGPNGGAEPLALAVVQPTQGELIVVNEVVNDNGGTAVVSDWTTIVTGGNPVPASFPGAGPPGTTVTLDPGSYSVAVATGGPAGYLHTFSPACDGTIAAGETRTCTVTHDDQPATLVVVNEVVNDDGGTAVASDWRVTVFAVSASPGSFAGTVAPGQPVTLDPGLHSLFANGPNGYRLSFSAGCGGPIAAGETRTCTITADDQPPTLVVGIRVVNDDGGTAVAADWTVLVSGANPVPANFPGVPAPPSPLVPGSTATVDPGAYSLSASGPAGYTSSLSAECAGTIAPLEIKFCTLTYDDQPGSLKVVNEVVNDNGGTAVVADWTVAVTGANPAPVSFPGTGPPGTTVTLDAGTYSVSQSGPTGYASTLSADCAGTIALGEARTCTITSDDDPPAVPTCDGKVATIVGGAGPTDLRGTSGNDVIVDLDGDNIVRGRGGSDTICTGPGDDQVIVAAGADTILDTGGDNTIESGAGADSITTAAGADEINAGAGNDTVDAGGGDNRANGQAGDDTLVAGAGSDDIDGGLGHDIITAHAGNDQVDAGGGDDAVDAGEGNNRVNGQAGNDTLVAGAGDDVIDGGLGFDACTRGGGFDTISRCEVVT